MGFRQFKNKRSRVIFDDEVVSPSCEKLFDREWLKSNSLCTLMERGKAVMFEYRGVDLVFKQYHRGGLAGRLVERSYLFSRLANTRMWREFNLLRSLHEMGLPVPRPVAARCTSWPPLAYRGALITERVPDSKTLTETLTEKSIPEESWVNLGRLIARFHKHNVYHADLNASNILLTGSGEFYLIDFDKGEFRTPLERRDADANVQRLRRSLNKLKGKNTSFHFTEDNWQALNQAYRAAMA